MAGPASRSLAAGAAGKKFTGATATAQVGTNSGARALSWDGASVPGVRWGGAGAGVAVVLVVRVPGDELRHASIEWDRASMLG